MEIASDRFSAPSPQSYTVLRARLDQWLAEKVGEKGAMVVPNMKVDELLRKGDRVIGIRAGDDEIGAQVVIVAEGVLRLLAAARGCRAAPAADHAVGYKEVIELPAGVIEDRWRLNPGEGAAQLFMGELTRGMMGGGFLYTNRDISPRHGGRDGADARRRDGSRAGSSSTRSRSCPDQAAGRRRHGGRVLGARHPRGRHRQVPRLAGDGYLVAGEAAGFALNALVTVRGMDFAIAWGWAAARAALAARAAGDSSAASLSVYERFLRETFVTADLEAGRGVPQAIENRRLFSEYPGAVARLLEGFFTVDDESSATLVRKSLRGARREFLNDRDAQGPLVHAQGVR